MTGQQAKKRNRGTKRKAKPPQPDTSKAKRSVSPNDDESEDPQFWRSSDSEPEDYGDLNGQEQWKIDGVVDSHRGENDRMSYKIRWNKKDWHRKDGTSEEWIPEPINSRNEHQKFIKAYQARELRRFTTSSVAAVSNEEHKPFTTGPPAVSKNLWHQAGLSNTLAMYQELREGRAEDAGIQKFSILDRDFLRGEFGSGSDSESESEDAPPRRPRPKTESPQSPSLGGSPRPSSRPPTPKKDSLLRILQTTWNEAATRVGAASITLSNTIDNTIPHLKHNFFYSEMDLKWTSDVEGHPVSDEMYVSCTQCSEQCDRAHACGCQEPLFATNTAGPRALHKFAYDTKGHFKLSHQDVVIECNKRCRCLESCPNRVAQKPRSVPIDIFKTRTRGWGVRPRKDVKAGEVLGTFTGEIIARKRAQDIPPDVAAHAVGTDNKVRFRDRNQYLFDLDARHEDYTLDCWKMGNWARFINHSCDPNLKIYAVCYDTLPDTGLERLGIVALRNIEAGEELTIDYHPGENSPNPKYQHAEDLHNCSCGAQNCRGIM